jgi:hypothetical protein
LQPNYSVKPKIRSNHDLEKKIFKKKLVSMKQIQKQNRSYSDKHEDLLI